MNRRSRVGKSTLFYTTLLSALTGNPVEAETVEICHSQWLEVAFTAEEVESNKSEGEKPTNRHQTS